MRISDWSSDVCSSDLLQRRAQRRHVAHPAVDPLFLRPVAGARLERVEKQRHRAARIDPIVDAGDAFVDGAKDAGAQIDDTEQQLASAGAQPRIVGKARSEAHTSELQSLMRISYAVFCLQKKKNTNTNEELDKRKNDTP